MVDNSFWVEKSIKTDHKSILLEHSLSNTDPLQSWKKLKNTASILKNNSETVVKSVYNIVNSLKIVDFLQRYLLSSCIPTILNEQRKINLFSKMASEFASSKGGKRNGMEEVYIF